MAEVMETHVPMGKINGGLTTGIIGTSLAGLLALKSGFFNNILGGGSPAAAESGGAVPFGSLYNERKENQDYIELTKQYYEGQIATREDLNNKFFNLYKIGNDNSFALYKQHVDDSFALYKSQRDSKDELLSKINEVEKKVDVMSAIRPYQDALINAKIDNVALVGDFNLQRKTCRMIQGELVLPSTPTVTGYASYSPCNPIAQSTGA